MPIREDDRIIGSIGILHDRAEYTKLMEDLSGTRYLVDSITGFPMDLIHTAATVIFLALAAHQMLEKLDRIKTKYGLIT